MKTQSLSLIGGLTALVLLAGCSQGGNPQEDSTSRAAGAPASSVATPAATQAEVPGAEASNGKDSASKKGKAPAETADLATTKLAVSPSQAISKATAKAGKGTVKSIEVKFKHRFGAWTYEIEVQRGTTEHEVRVDATSGKVLSHTQERDPSSKKGIDPTKPLSYKAALKLAQAQLQKTGGKGRLATWQLEYDDGLPTYQFEFGDEPNEVEINVDVKSKRTWVDD